MRPFVTDADGRARIELAPELGAPGTVVQPVLVNADGTPSLIGRARDLPFELVEPPAPPVPAARSGPPKITSVRTAPCTSGSPCAAGTEDRPDRSFLDTNCDGIDGDVTRAVLVDWATGSLAASGDISDPLSGVAGTAAPVLQF